MNISQYIPLISGCGLEHLEDFSIQVGFCHVIMSSQLLLKLHHFSEGLKPQPPTRYIVWYINHRKFTMVLTMVFPQPVILTRNLRFPYFELFPSGDGILEHPAMPYVHIPYDP